MLFHVQEPYCIQICTVKIKVTKANSAIHKAVVQPAAIQNGLWRAFCIVASFDILGIIPGKPVEWP